MQPAVGVIGAGKIAQRHVAAYKELGCKAIYLTDIGTDVAAARAASWHVNHVAHVTDLLAMSGIAAIDVCTPTPFHAEYTLAALNAGKHVFCEKPLCLLSEEAELIREAAIRANRIVMVGYLYRFHPAFQFVKSVLEKDVIGQPYMAILRLGGRGSAATWKHTRAEGGGAIAEMMAHMIDLATWYFGYVKSVTTLWQTTLLPERQVGEDVVEATAEDFSVVRLQAGSVQILCESDLATPSYMQHIEIQGDNGSIFSSILHTLPTIVFCKESRSIYDPGNNIYTFPQEDLFVKELGDFLQTINSDTFAVSNLDESVHTVHLLEQIHRAGLVPARSTVT